MRVNKLLALVMIYLIMSLIFSTALVFATIYKAEAYGQDEIPGIIRESDTLEIRTQSVMPCSVKADFTGNVYEEMTCGAGTPVICTYTYSASNFAGRVTARVKEGVSGNTEEVYAYVDNLAPRIDSFTTTSLGNKVRGIYSITELGNTYYPGRCSGVKDVELYIDGVLANTISHPKGECLVTGSITGTKPGFVGSVNTSLKVYDYIGFFDNKTGPSVSIDASNPVIKEAVKVLKAGTDAEVLLVDTNSIVVRDVDVRIEIEDDLISSTNSVFGNFTDFDKTNTQDQSSIGANCVGSGWISNTYNCTFSNVKLCPLVINPGFFVRAIDQLGNMANTTLTASFTEVTGVGEVIRLGPEPYRCVEDVCYVRAGINNITAEISPGSSYLDNNVFIQGVRADCNKATNWICQADVNINMGETIINLVGTDDFGNPITAQVSIVVDNQVPVIIGELTSEPECPKSGETLEIRLNVSEAESPGVIISANTSEISEDNKTMAECEEVDSNEWECVLSISNIKDQEINTELEVIVEDFAGNEIIESINVSICVEIGEIPNLISEVKTKPPLPRIDRKTASKITLNMPVPLEIVNRIEGIEIIDRSLVDCSDTPGLVGQEYMINDYGFNPVLILPLRYDYSSQEEWDDDDKIEVNCTFEFNIKHGNTRYTEPEAENISFKLEVYNLALGNISENYNKKIEEIKQEIRRLDKQIEKYQKVYNMLGKLCKLAETIGNINRIVQSVKAAIWGVCVVINAIIPGLGDTIWNPVHGALSGLHNIVETSIWPTGWVPVGGNTLGLVIKGGCSIYTCKFYEFNTFVDIGMSIAAHYATKNDKKITGREKNLECDGEHGCGTLTAYEDGSYEMTYEDGTRAISTPDGTITTYTTNTIGENKFVETLDGSITAYKDDEIVWKLEILPDGNEKFTHGSTTWTKEYNVNDRSFTITYPNGHVDYYDPNGIQLAPQSDTPTPAPIIPPTPTTPLSPTPPPTPTIPPDSTP
nr:hypothetical protein [Nanoarchaeota archaeon]